MKLGLMGATVVLGLGLTIGGAYTYVNAQSGDPTLAKNAVSFGISQTAGMAGEAASIIPKTIEQVKPALTQTMGQAGSVLGGPATSVPAARTDQVDPADQGAGQ